MMKSVVAAATYSLWASARPSLTTGHGSLRCPVSLRILRIEL